MEKATGHQFGEWVVDVKPTEKTEGHKYRECKCGEKEEATIPKLNHVHKPVLVEEVKATCTKTGTKAYYYCEGCNKYFEDKECTKNIPNIDEWKVVPAKGHKSIKVAGKPATCTEAGTKEYYHCERCNKYFEDKECTKNIPNIDEWKVIPTIAHKLTKVEAKAPTCTVDGSKEYWTCSACNKIFADAEGKTETTLDKLVEKATGHQFGEWVVDVKPTEKTEGHKYRECKCGEKEEATIPKLNHVHKPVLVEEVKATCTKTGTKAYYYCEGCNKYFEDKECTKNIPNLNEWKVIPAKGHTPKKVVGKPATCTEAGTKEYYHCEVCNKYFEDKECTKNIPNIDEWKVVPAIGHKLTKVEAKAPTCTEAGNKEYWTCNDCKKMFSDAEGKTEITKESVIIPAKGHKLTKVEAKAPTCTEAGNKEYWTCSACNKIFADAEGKTETTKEAVILKALGHDWKVNINWADDGSACDITRECSRNPEHKETAVVHIKSEITTPATCTDDGTTTYTATYKFGEEKAATVTKEIKDVKAIGHDYSDPVITFAEDGKTAKAEVICKNDSSHTIPLKAEVKAVVKVQPAVNVKGTTTYTATVVYNEKVYTLRKDIQDIPALEEKLEQKELKEVPENLKETKFDTVEKIEDALKEKVLPKLDGKKITGEKKTVVFDAVLNIVDKVSGTQRPATKEEVEALGGITVVIPYPNGTNGKDFVFSVAHMLTVSMNGMQAGDIETPEVTLTDAGIKVTLKGLSPVMVTYAKKAEEATKPADPAEPEKPAKPEKPKKPANKKPANPKTPPTGDTTNFGTYGGLAVMALVAVVAVMFKRKKYN